MNVRTAVFAFVGLLAGVTYAQETTAKSTLAVGDPAPKMTVSKWVKGGPINELKKGNLYVVEFWATWCGPCKVSIPHLTEMAKKYKGKVNFIGVSVFESDPKEVAPFVKSMGAKMDYNVAMDKLPTPTSSGTEGAMAQSWMVAAAQEGIPTAFIVDKDGKVAWIGHPMSMEEPLEKVVAGTWDTKSFGDQAKQEAAAKTKMRDYQQKLQDAMKNDKDDEILAVLDSMLADDSSQVQTAGAMLKFGFLLEKKKDYDGAYAFAKTAITGVLKDNADALNSLAWEIVAPEAKWEKRDLDVAIAAGQRSVDIRKESANLDTLARAYFLKGDKEKAIALEKEALTLAATDDEKADLQKSLKEFGG